jgi:hypothetical protein
VCGKSKRVHDKVRDLGVYALMRLLKLICANANLRTTQLPENGV